MVRSLFNLDYITTTMSMMITETPSTQGETKSTKTENRSHLNPYRDVSSRIPDTTSTAKTFSSRRNRSRHHSGSMYGDLVNALCYTAFLPVYGYMWICHPSDEGRIVSLCFAWTALFSWYSYWKESPAASMLAFIGMEASIASMNLLGWPHVGQVVVQPQFLWSLLIIGGNTALTLTYKVAMTALALGSSMLICAVSPLVSSLLHELPFLLFFTVVHGGLQWLIMSSNKQTGVGALSAQGASVVLGASFAYLMSSELIKIVHEPEYAKQGGYSILQAGFFAVIGLCSAGAFRREQDVNEVLERKVQGRTTMIMQQAKKLYMVEHALQASETCIAITDAERNVVWWNSAIERLTSSSSSPCSSTSTSTSCSTRRLQGRNILDILNLPAADDEKMYASFQATLTAGATATQALCFWTHGKYVSAEISRFPSSEHFDDDDHHHVSHKKQQQQQDRFLVVLRDLTAEKAREDAEQKAVKQAMIAKAMEESMQTLSHELRTPLQGIMGLASILLRQSISVQETRENITMIMISASHLLTLINNLLDIRKLDSNMMDEFQLSPIKLKTSLQAAMDFCRACASISKVQLELCLDDENGNAETITDVMVDSNPLRLEQVMINLLSNAIKYTAPASKVSVRASVHSQEDVVKMAAKAIVQSGPLPAMLHLSGDGHSPPPPSSTSPSSLLSETSPAQQKFMVISVCDCGPGVGTSDDAANIFDKFTQLDTQPVRALGGPSTGQVTGTGLGLNLCAKFLQRMKGFIWVTNNPHPDRGATFSFCIPLSSSAHENGGASAGNLIKEAEVISKPKMIRLSRSDISTKYRVLVVDDTIINLKVTHRMLKSLGVEQVGMASSGSEALRELREQDYNLVITDVQMPEMSGMELSEAIHQSWSHPTAKPPRVVAFTADTSESVAKQCLQAGMESVLHKPLTAERLIEFFETF